jgi:hypothetical protein
LKRSWSQPDIEAVPELVAFVRFDYEVVTSLVVGQKEESLGAGVKEVEASIAHRKDLEPVALLIGTRVRFDDPIRTCQVAGHEQELAVVLDTEELDFLDRKNRHYPTPS